jgi:hypothetical protein
VVHAGGRPLILDPGTGSYTFDPVARDRFRGTSAHATVVVAGREQSPILPKRPFALPDRARTSPVAVEDLDEVASLCAEHCGYRALGVRHRRRLTLFRALGALLIEDELEGRGLVPVEVRFPIAGAARVACAEPLRARVAALEGRLGRLDLDGAVELEGAALVPLAENPLPPRVEEGWSAPHFGEIRPAGVVTFSGLLSLPRVVAVVLLALA